MNLLRPELAAALHRWREPLGWGALALAGVWLALRGLNRDGLLLAAGVIAAAVGGAMLVGAVQRVRLRGQAPGEGVLVTDEGRIGYFGPHGGGFADLSRIVRVEVGPIGGGPAWTLVSEDGERLVVPAGARGSEALADALAALPGIDMRAAVAAIATPRALPSVVWRQSGATPAAELASPRRPD
jgi:hypothetical protein